MNRKESCFKSVLTLLVRSGGGLILYFTGVERLTLVQFRFLRHLIAFAVFFGRELLKQGDRREGIVSVPIDNLLRRLDRKGR